MPWADVHWRSDVLQKQTTMQVLLPRVGTPPWPVYYLYHGLSDDSSTWLRNTRIEYYVRELPLIVVMPDLYRGFGTDNEEGPAYARHLGREVVDFVDRNFQAVAKREGRAVGGLSMGGYAAMRVALGFPDRFVSANSFSGALGRSNADFSAEAEAAGRHKDKEPGFLDELRRVFGHQPLGSRHDLLELAKAAQAKKQLPHLLLDCGKDDYLLQDSREFARVLKEANLPHEYREHAGAHDWDYWDLHVQEALQWHCGHLKVERIPLPR